MTLLTHPPILSQLTKLCLGGVTVTEGDFIARLVSGRICIKL